jgi:hypothetical protein
MKENETTYWRFCFRLTAEFPLKTNKVVFGGNGTNGTGLQCGTKPGWYSFQIRLFVWGTSCVTFVPSAFSGKPDPWMIDSGM